MKSSPKIRASHTGRPFAMIGALTGALLAAACQSSLASEAAVLESADAQTMAKVKSVLAGAMGTAAVELGAGDPTETPSIAVLPRPPGPNEDRSPAMPVLFDLILKENVCYAVRRDTGAAYELTGVACKPVN